jgi:hypothetical protein
MKLIQNKSIFICLDHGLAVFYFLQSEIIPTLLQAGAEVILLTDDNSIGQITDWFGRPGVTIEGLRLDKVQAYQRNVKPSRQWWIDFLRRAGSASNTNLAVVDGYIQQVKYESSGRRKQIFPLMEGLARLMRHSQPARKMLLAYQNRFTSNIYSDLFDKYKPSLVIAGSPGFRQDRYLLREAKDHNVPSAAAIISWDSSSSYGLPGAPVDRVTCWSEIQKRELMGGADWTSEQVNIGGMPPYDNYLKNTWVMPRQEYFQLHGLDPSRKLLSYASSFVSWSPNIQNIEALVSLVADEQLSQPCQLLIRLHPIHMSGHYVSEADRIRELARQHKHIHIVEPTPMGSLGHYGEDVTERTSMMAHSDIFLTVYSTMVVEASFQETPTISVCIDAESGFPGKYWVPMSQIGVWPTHSRFRTSGAGRVALDTEQLRTAINDYLENPHADLEAQRRFLKQECTFLDGSSGRRTAEFFLSLFEN